MCAFPHNRVPEYQTPQCYVAVEPAILIQDARALNLEAVGDIGGVANLGCLILSQNRLTNELIDIDMIKGQVIGYNLIGYILRSTIRELKPCSFICYIASHTGALWSMVPKFGGITLLTLIFGSCFIASPRSLAFTPSNGRKNSEKAALLGQDRQHILTEREEPHLQT